MEYLNDFLSSNDNFFDDMNSVYGYGFGFGDAVGSGSFVESSSSFDFCFDSVNNYKVHLIDCIPTILEKIKKTKGFYIAKGKILKNDFTFQDTFVVKKEACFAHGLNLKQAFKSLNEKLFDKLDAGQKMDEFFKHFDFNKKYDAKDFFIWHGKLTKSCEFGRKFFVENNNINMNKKYSIKEFVDICKDQYGYEIISKILDYEN
jgi:hypothetical protein